MWGSQKRARNKYLGMRKCGIKTKTKREVEITIQSGRGVEKNMISMWASDVCLSAREHNLHWNIYKLDLVGIKVLVNNAREERRLKCSLWMMNKRKAPEPNVDSISNARSCFSVLFMDSQQHRCQAVSLVNSKVCQLETLKQSRNEGNPSWESRRQSLLSFSHANNERQLFMFLLPQPPPTANLSSSSMRFDKQIARLITRTRQNLLMNNFDLDASYWSQEQHQHQQL